MIIAVDGPAASGKGTIARALAAHYGLPHMDTGLLYRAVALNLLRWGGDAADEEEALRACDFSQIDFADPELKSEAAGGIASRISVYPLVRAALIKRQRDFAGQPGGAVLDGRDIGTVIAPDADAKLFVTARPEERAKRRCAELGRMGLNVHYDDVLIDIRARDERDSSRAMAPLLMAEDSALLDNSDLPVNQAIAQAIAAVERAVAKANHA
jgi:cytidylate kinase